MFKYKATGLDNLNSNMLLINFLKYIIDVNPYLSGVFRQTVVCLLFLFIVVLLYLMIL